MPRKSHCLFAGHINRIPTASDDWIFLDKGRISPIYFTLSYSSQFIQLIDFKDILTGISERKREKTSTVTKHENCVHSHVQLGKCEF